MFLIGCDLRNKNWKLHCKSPVSGFKALCCARYHLADTPNFRAQRSALQEAVEDAGHISELYLKFHCECNWIERYWEAEKRQARLHCDYTFKSLEKNIPNHPVRDQLLN